MKVYNGCLAFIMLLTICSCTNDPKFDDPVNSNEYTNLYVEENVEIFQVENGASAFNLLTRDNCQLIFPANAFYRDNEVYSGSIEVEFLLIYEKVEMVLSGMHTMYTSRHGEDYLLESGGELWIQVRDQEGNQLQLRPRARPTVRVPLSLANATNSPMYLYQRGDVSSQFSTSDFWMSLSGDISGLLPETEGAYDVFLYQFGWLNCDYILEFPEPYYNVNYTYPTGFNADNSSVLLSLKSLPNSLAVGDWQVPSNEECTLIFITRNASNFYIASEDFVALDDVEVDFNESDLKVLNIDEARAYLSEILK